ncbi:MAG: superinfection immunity protein [Acidobacteriales bacterium]|nr:superinfection immunity protein [Terriglobales bacterium]
MSFVFICIAFAFYFLPAIIAHKRYHPSSGAIFLVNFFLGWTCIGWIVCLVWALSGERRLMVLQPAEHIIAAGRFCTRCGGACSAGVCPTCGAKM